MKHIQYLFLLLLLLVWNPLFSQKIIAIETENNALILNVDGWSELKMVYYGSKLQNTEEYNLIAQSYNQPDDYSKMLNSAYTPSGSRNLAEPALSVVHADGNMSLNLK
ncbi:MAG: alpha-galactosidase, partial [Cyclobacteriaceae bacterium]